MAFRFLLSIVCFMGLVLSAREQVVPAIMDLTGGRVLQSGANQGAGEKIRPAGWSRDGKFAWIVEHFVDGRGGTTFAFIITDTRSDKVLERIDDDSENWEKHQEDDDFAEAWRRNVKRWNDLLQTHGIVPGSGLGFRPLPLKKGTETFRASLDLLPASADTEDRELFPRSGFVLRMDNGTASKVVGRSGKLPMSEAWVSGCFFSPFEQRMLVVVVAESFAFEGTEFFYHFYGCKLDSGFKKER